MNKDKQLISDKGILKTISKQLEQHIEGNKKFDTDLKKNIDSLEGIDFYRYEILDADLRNKKFEQILTSKNKEDLSNIRAIKNEVIIKTPSLISEAFEQKFKNDEKVLNEIDKTLGIIKKLTKEVASGKSEAVAENNEEMVKECELQRTKYESFEKQLKLNRKYMQFYELDQIQHLSTINNDIENEIKIADNVRIIKDPVEALDRGHKLDKAIFSLGKVNNKHLSSAKDILKATDQELKQQFKDDKNIDVDLKQENK